MLDLRRHTRLTTQGVKLDRAQRERPIHAALTDVLADRDRPREFGIHESDGAPDEKERRPKHQHLVTKLHDGAVKCGLGVSSRLTQAHRAVPS